MAGLASEVIKEYLVSLGFKVDEKSLGSFNNALKKAQVGVKTYVAAMSALAVGVAKFVSSMYQKDLQLERDAKSTKKSIEATRAYTNALKAMGVTADQIKKDSKLKALSNELQALGKEMALPKGSEAISTVRDLMNEFTKFKYVGTYVLDWINYKFKTLAGVQLKGITDSLKSFRLRIQTNMPKISTGIATAMKFVASAVNSVLRVVNGVFSLIDRIPDKVKLIIGAIAGAIAVIKAGPLGRIGALLVGITLLLDDFFVHMDGGKAALGPFWDDCLDLFDTLKTSIGDAITKLKEDGTLGSIWTSLQEIASSIASAITSIVTAIFGSETGNDGRFQKFGDLLSNTIQVAVKAIADALDIMATGLEWVAKILNKANEMGILSDALTVIAGSLAAIAALKGLDKAAGFINALKGLSGKSLSGWAQTMLEKTLPNLTTLFSGKKGKGKSAAETTVETVVETAAEKTAETVVEKATETVTKKVAKKTGEAAGKAVSEAVSDVVETAASSALETAANAATGVGSAALDKVLAIGKAVIGAGSDIIQTVSSGSAAKKQKSAAKETDAAADSLADAAGALKSAAEGDLTDGAKALGDSADHFTETADDMAESASAMQDDVTASADALAQRVGASVETTGQSVLALVETGLANVCELVSAAAQQLSASISSLASSAASAAGSGASFAAAGDNSRSLGGGSTRGGGGGRQFSNGGVVWGQQSVTVGENNDPEAIIPLNKPRRALELLRYSLGYMGITPQSLLGAQAMLGASGAGNAIPAYAGASASGRGNVYHNTSNTSSVQAPVHMNVYGSDASATAHATANILQRRWMHNVQGVILA